MVRGMKRVAGLVVAAIGLLGCAQIEDEIADRSRSELSLRPAPGEWTAEEVNAMADACAAWAHEMRPGHACFVSSVGRVMVHRGSQVGAWWYPGVTPRLEVNGSDRESVRRIMLHAQPLMSGFGAEERSCALTSLAPIAGVDCWTHIMPVDIERCRDADECR